MQHAGHCPRNCGAVDKCQLPVEDGLIVGIEADDESGQHPQSGLLNYPNLFHHVPPEILKLLRSLQRLGGRRFDAEEDVHEVGLHHRSHQLRPVRQIDGRFGVEREGTSVNLLPRGQRVRQQQSLLAVPNEVVIDDEHLVTPAEFAERIQFRDHLLGRFRPGASSVDGDDVAEFALKRAPA